MKIEAINLEGQAFELEADGLLAVCIQHEMDHLNGKLFVDYCRHLNVSVLEKSRKVVRQREREKLQ